jgi:hypothetical protein
MASFIASLMMPTGREGGNAKGFHYDVACYRGLPIADVVLFLDFFTALFNHLEIGEIALHFEPVFRGNITLAQDHQVVKVIARVKQDTANGGICDILVRQADRS